METTTQYDTKPLLRPAQLEEMRNQVKIAEAKLNNPAILDKGEARKQLIRGRQSLESQTPKPPVDAAEEGRMVARSKQLLDDVLAGMPSQEEMRKAPPGAVDKHMGWETRNKPKILEWKNLQLRLRPGEREAANLERHRPVSSTLLMDNLYIQGRNMFIPEGVGATVTFSDAELVQMDGLKPGLRDTVGSMTNEQRAVVKDMLALMPVAGHKGAAKKRKMSEAQKTALKAGREAAMAAKRAQDAT